MLCAVRTKPFRSLTNEQPNPGARPLVQHWVRFTCNIAEAQPRHLVVAYRFVRLQRQYGCQ